MLKQSCNCGCNLFHVNKKDMMLYCPICNQRYLHTSRNKWIEFNLTKKEKFFNSNVSIKEKFDVVFQSLSDWRKQNNIVKLKKNLKPKSYEELKLINDYEKQVELERKQLECVWSGHIEYLKNNKIISFDKNEHKGRVRGKHIAVKFHSDLKKIGIETKLYFRKDKAFVELVVK